MDPDRVIRLLTVAVVGTLLGGTLLAHTGLLPVPAGEYDRQNVQVTDCDGTQLAELDTRVAATTAQQYVGLSRTARLAPDEGMVFPDSEESDRQIVMRGMSIPLDVLFVGSDGRITSIVTLSAPDGPIERHFTYEGVTRRGQFVIEARAGWANRTGVSVGDCVDGLPS